MVLLRRSKDALATIRAGRSKDEERLYISGRILRQSSVNSIIEPTFLLLFDQGDEVRAIQKVKPLFLGKRALLFYPKFH